MNWSDSTVVILTCERDRYLVDLCQLGIKKFWPGVNLAVLWDHDRTTETDIPADVREVVRRLPYLRKVFDMPYIAPTDQLYCIDSDCLLFAEPSDWGPSMHLGMDGVSDHELGVSVWAELGYTFTRNSPRFCGGCWSAKRSEMFEPHKDLAIRYVRKCVEIGYDRRADAPVVCEQCLLAGLWRMTYKESLLSNERYPLYLPNPDMVVYHLSDMRNAEPGHYLLEEYRKLVTA